MIEVRIFNWLISPLFCAAVIHSPIAKADIKCGDSEIETVSIQDTEGTSILIRIKDSNDLLIYPQILYRGSFLPLCRSKKFLLLDDNVHYKPGQSFLLSSDGKVTNRYDFGEIAYFDKSEDDEIFWVQRFIAESDSLKTLLSVFSANGNLIIEKNFDSSFTFKVMHLGTEYTIEVAEPQYPG